MLLAPPSRDPFAGPAFTPPARAPMPTPVALPDVLAALSHALDLTEGQAPGHSVRSCIIGMRLADELGLDRTTRFALYYALLLKDAGCSSNAGAMSALFGTDDQVVKPRMKRVDWHQPVRLALHTARAVGLGQPLRARIAYFAGIARRAHVTRDLIRIRCDRGAAVALQLGFPKATANAIASLDEHWNGEGHPIGLHGDAIPLLSRIANLAQTVEVAHHEHDTVAVMEVVKARRGRWFDPRLADIVHGWRKDRGWWAALRTATVNEVAALAVTLGAEPDGTLAGSTAVVDEARLDAVAAAFADIIDAKSPYTFRHSTGVSTYAVMIAEQMGLAPDVRLDLRRAGLLHDIGKLGVSNRILDKPGALTPEERKAVQQHAAHSWDILSRVSAFSRFARTASLHHERLDGTGYPWGLKAPDLDTPARVLAVADVYEALTADRPYRAGLAPTVALAIIDRERGTALCPDVADALAARVSGMASDSALPAAGTGRGER